MPENISEISQQEKDFKVPVDQIEVTEQKKEKSLNDLIYQAKLGLLSGLAGRTLGGGRRIPALNSSGKLPTFEGRGNSYITYIGDALDAMSLKELAALPEAELIVQKFIDDENIQDPVLKQKILNSLK